MMPAAEVAGGGDHAGARAHFKVVIHKQNKQLSTSLNKLTYLARARGARRRLVLCARCRPYFAKQRRAVAGGVVMSATEEAESLISKVSEHFFTEEFQGAWRCQAV